MISAFADLNGSSAGMRSSQRCSESFSWSEKFSSFGFGRGLLFVRGARLRGGLGWLGGIVGGFALELEEHFLAEAETLRPAFHFVACLLRYFFVGAEIENQEVVGHASCITKFGSGWLGVGGLGVEYGGNARRRWKSARKTGVARADAA
jgi:hypothetical protein